MVGLLKKISSEYFDKDEYLELCKLANENSIPYNNLYEEYEATEHNLHYFSTNLEEKPIIPEWLKNGEYEHYVTLLKDTK